MWGILVKVMLNFFQCCEIVPPKTKTRKQCSKQHYLSKVLLIATSFTDKDVLVKINSLLYKHLRARTNLFEMYGK